jgi:hypothetical protein
LFIVRRKRKEKASRLVNSDGSYNYVALHTCTHSGKGVVVAAAAAAAAAAAVVRGK